MTKEACHWTMMKALVCKYHRKVSNKCRQIPQTTQDKWTAAVKHKHLSIAQDITLTHTQANTYSITTRCNVAC